MAYDASNVNNQNDQQQVAGATPLGQGGGQSTPAAQPDGGAQGPSTPATVQTGGQQAQPQNPNRPQKSAGSGMFTNIQSYVQKNQPAAQKMAGAVSQNVGDQASEIRQATEQKKAQQDAALQANQAAMDRQKQEAAGIIQQQTGVAVGGFQPPAQAPTPEQSQAQTPNIEDQAARFQQLSQGPEGITQVGDLNLGQQNLKAQALQQMAQGANTEQGRMNLLKNTFQGQTPTGYTRGMSGLDNLVVSGDQAAREQMIQGTQQQTQELQQQMQDIGSEASKNKMANDLAISKFGSDISGLSQEAQDAILAEVDANVASQQQEWAAQIAQMQEQANQEFTSGMKFGSAQDFYNSLLNQNVGWNKAGDRATLDNALMRMNLLGEDVNLADVYKSRKLGDRTAGFTDEQRDFLSKNIVLGTDGSGRIGGALGDLLQNAADYGIDVGSYTKQLQDLAQGGNRRDIYGYSGHQDNKGTNVQTYDAAKFKEITDSLFNQIGSAKDNALQRMVENKFGDQYRKALGEGQTFDDFLSGGFIDRTGAANEEQVRRMEALQKLTGAQTNALGTETGSGFGQDTALFQALRERLNNGTV
jgi:hypothetical protein